MVREEAQFSYQEGDEYIFMDTTTFDTFNVDKDSMGNAANYMIEGLEVRSIQVQRSKIVSST